MESIKPNENLCRICLSSDRSVVLIKDTYLQDVYENITNIQLHSNYIQSLCHMCLGRLRNCHKLIQEASLSDKLLKDALQCGTEINKAHTQAYKLSTSLTINISLDPIEFDIKEENSKIKKELQEDKFAIDAGQIDVQDQDDNSDLKDFSNPEDLKSNVDTKECLSDSEDDLPLKNISLKQHLEETFDDAVTIKFKKYNKDTKVDAQELILDEEQQILEMVERSKSQNYINSPYKCDLCFKGFLDPVAFDKHKDKHDETSGQHECKLCHLRYSTAKSLRAHTVSTHSRRFACNVCGHRSHTKHQAKCHERWHKGHTYPCKPCGRSFSKPTSYLSHVRSCSLLSAHAPELVCRECGRGFVRAHGLRMHISKEHRTLQKTSSEPESERICVECDIQFSSSEARTRHILMSKKHTLFKDNDSKCGLCGVRVPACGRAAHRRGHATALALAPARGPALRAACDQCEATFSSRAKLQSHVKRIHLGLKYNKNIVCEICGKKCTSNATLTYHQRRHTGEKPYHCDKCPSRFISKEQLRIHGRSHSGERPYSCALCGNRFSQKPALNRHYRVHTGAKPYECHVCNKPFSQSNSLKTHIRTVHLRLPPNKKKKDQTVVEDSEKNDNVLNV